MLVQRVLPFVFILLVIAQVAPGQSNRAASNASRALENRQRGLERRGTVPSLATRGASASGTARAIERRPDFVLPGRGTGRLARDVERGRAFGWSRQEDRRPVDAWERVRRSRDPHGTDDSIARDEAGHGRQFERRDARGGHALDLADRQLAKRLAQIDRMRDRALETGNENLYRQADHLERIARQQLARRTFEGDSRDRNTEFPLRPEQRLVDTASRVDEPKPRADD